MSNNTPKQGHPSDFELEIERYSDNQKLTLDIRPSNERLELLELWKQLGDRWNDVPLVCSFLWVKNWLNFYEDQVKHRFAIAIYREKPVGMTLLTEGADEKDGPFHVCSLHLGTSGETEWAESVDQALDIFNDMVTLHQARWQAIGNPGSYSSDRFCSFQKALICDLLPAKKMGMFRVSNEEGVIGCNQMLFDNNRVWVYQTGCVVSTSKKSSGLISDYLCLQSALERGYDAYDLLGGATHHKERLSKDFNTIVWAKSRRKRMKFQIVNVLRRCKQLLFKNK